ncbi:MAG: hypothetical protein PVH17_09435 [Anaerolineae bacterium]|jgi:hypothetical protein
MSSRQPTGVAHVDFFTTTHRISGAIQTGPRRLSDVLNDRSQSYLLVSSVYVSRLDKPGEIGAHAPVAYLSKENLCFVIVPSQEARFIESGRFRVQKSEALVTLPGFEVRGTFVGPRRADVRSFSPAALDAFLVLTEATAQNIAAPKVVYQGKAILVNQAYLESLCLME